MTCVQGEKHRWDESRSHCLDCGREAATIADEVWEWLGEKEDWIDHMGDQIEALRVLLEETVGQLDGAGEKMRAKLAELEAEYYPE